MIDTLTDLIDDPGFRAACGWAALGAAVVAAVALALRRRVPLAGVVVAGAAVAALDRHVLPVDDQVVLALALLAAGGYLADRWALHLVAAVPGALVLAAALPTDPGWVRPVVVATTVVGGAAAADLDRAAGRGASRAGAGVQPAPGVGPVLVAVTVAGVYLTVPDTEMATVLLGAALPAAALGWPFAWGRLGGGGALATVAVVAWTVALDGRGRLGSVVGGVACLGLLALEPVLRRLGALRPARGVRDALVLVAVHAVLVAWCSRVAGLRTDVEPALVLALAGHAVAGAALVAAARAAPDRPGPGA
ncbi:MAG: hypothetical protein C0P77_006580 [Thermoanaerobacterales bacterium]|nr:hypothetical protein [Thermoanaerobacterales bacterium]